MVLIAVLTGIAAVALGPLYLLPVFAVVFWYAITRVAVHPAAILPWIAVYSLLGDKMIVSTGVGGGQGLLRFGPLLSVVVLAAMLLADAATRQAAVDTLRWGSPAVLFVAFGSVLPFLGIMSDAPARTITAAIGVLAMGASLVFGVLVARSGADRDRVRYVMLLVVASVAAVAGVLLFLFNRGITLPLAKEINQWGIATAEAYGNTWLLGRTGGLYTSPNIFGTVGGLTLIFAAFGRLTRGQRVSLVVPALAVLFVTQSRSAILAVAVAIAMGALFKERRSEIVQWQTVVTWVLVMVLVVATLAGVSAMFPRYLEILTGRITSAAHILTEGPAADRNFAGRVVFWKSAWQLLQERPLGTWGPPELVLGSAVDNDYLRFALQGGILYAGVWILYLVWLMTTGFTHHADRFIGAGGVYLALTALTQTTSTHVIVIGMFTLFVGMHIEGIRVRGSTSQTPHSPQETGEG